MTPRRGRPRLRAQDGFAIIEVLVSGVIAVTAAAGIMALMQTSIHSTGELRKRSQSYAVAQEDQARMRAMRVASLKLLTAKAPESREVTLDGVVYTVVSSAVFVSDATSAASCGTSADYIKTTSEVSWPAMRSGLPKTILRSIIAPPTESLKPKSGNFSVFVKDGFGKGVFAVGISGSGPSTISGSTDETGCALFTEVPEGLYNVTPSGTGLVDKDGKSPSATAVTVNPEATTTLELQYAQGGSVPFKFETKNYSNALQAAKPDTMVIVNSEMTSGTKGIGTVGTPLTSTGSYTVSPLFPFEKSDTFYTGSCITNDPVTGNARAAVVVPAGTSAPLQTLILPALRLTVKKIETTMVKEKVKEKVKGKEVEVEKEVEKEVESSFKEAKVKVTDKLCEVGGAKVARNVLTNSNGQLENPGYPWSTYEVCVSGTVTTGIGAGKVTKTRRIVEPSVELHNETTDLNLTISGATPEGLACF